MSAREQADSAVMGNVHELEGELAWAGSDYRREVVLVGDREGNVAAIRFEDLVGEAASALLDRIKADDVAKMNAEVAAFASRRAARSQGVVRHG